MGKLLRQVRDIAYSLLTGAAGFVAGAFLVEFFWKPSRPDLGGDFDWGNAVIAGFYAIRVGAVCGLVAAVLMYRKLRRKHVAELPPK